MVRNTLVSVPICFFSFFTMIMIIVVERLFTPPSLPPTLSLSLTLSLKVEG